MTTAGKKEYTLKINGIETSIQDTTSLLGVLKAIDAEMLKNNTIGTQSTAVTREKTKAVTEEEKAAKKLEETQRKVKAALEGTTDAQVKANQALKDATREQSLRVQAETASINSVAAMRVKLSQLKEEWTGIEVGTEAFNEMSERIRVLNDQLKAAEEGTGDFRRNVGNYKSVLDGLDKVQAGVEGASKSTMGLAQGLLSVNMAMSIFGAQSEEGAKQALQLQKVIAMLSMVQQVNTNILKEGIVQNKLAAVTDAIRAVKIKAKAAAEAASTKGTVAATIAQKTFNAVASANPYVVLAIALGAVGTALFAFVRNTENAAEKQKKLNEIQEQYLNMLEEETRQTTQVSNDRISNLERQLKVLEAQEGKQQDIRALENEIAAERSQHNAYLRGFYAQEVSDLENNRKKLDEYRKLLIRLQDAQLRGDNKLFVDLDLNGSVEKVDVKGAIEAIQGRINTLGRSVEIATTLNTEAADLEAEEKALQARRTKEAKEAAKEAKEAAKERASLEKDAVRASEDARTQLIQNSQQRAREALRLSYDRQVEDLKKRLETEKKLTVNARKAIADTIESLTKQKAVELETLEREQAAQALALQHEVEDSRTTLIVGSYDRQAAEIKSQYDRQVEDYKKRLQEDKTLTEQQQQQLTELIVNAQKARGAALASLSAQQLDQEAEQQLTAVEDALTAIQNKVGDAVVRSKSGLQLIDVEATRRNLDAVNTALDAYVKGLQEQMKSAESAHTALLATMQKGTPEYEAETQRYTRATEEATQRIREAQKEQSDNTKASSQVQIEAYRDLLEKVQEYANEAINALSSVFDTWNMGIQLQLDTLTAQLDTLMGRYEEAQKQREDAVKHVEDIEAQLQKATGGTTEALKAQLQDAMHARAAAEREEQRLAKEKERREVEIADKEKQLRRNEVIMGIAQAVANTAQGVTSALKLGIPGIVFAAIIGAMGAVQVGTMSKQLTKLADGGEIIGASHAEGGIPVAGTNYEVEGGEFVVNKKSYSANADLVRFINDSPRAVTAADILGILPSTTPAPALAADSVDSAALVEAIKEIKFEPVVAVTDITKVAGGVVLVQDLSDF